MMKYALGLFAAVVLYLWWSAPKTRTTTAGAPTGVTGLAGLLGALLGGAIAKGQETQKPNAAQVYPLGLTAPNTVMPGSKVSYSPMPSTSAGSVRSYQSEAYGDSIAATPEEMAATSPYDLTGGGPGSN